MESRFPLPRHFQCGDLKVIKEVTRLRLEGVSSWNFYQIIPTTLVKYYIILNTAIY